MKVKFGIIILIGLIISNVSLAQDTTHERLVDKYYPKAEQAPPVPKTAKADPVTNTTTQPSSANAPVKSAIPLNATITAPPPDSEPVAPLNEINNEVTPVTQTASQVEAPQSPINNEAGKINKSINTTKKGTDNYNPDPKSPIYRDTRLGSSSPLYNTYQKNNNGAGAITTNPNKG